MITPQAIEVEKLSLTEMPNLRTLFANILADNDKYPVLNRDNLTIPVEMILSMKQKTFSQVFSFLLNSSLNFKHFERKDDPHRFCISEITESENVLR